jgi:hypothetical protein
VSTTPQSERRVQRLIVPSPNTGKAAPQQGSGLHSGYFEKVIHILLRPGEHPSLAISASSKVLL